MYLIYFDVSLIIVSLGGSVVLRGSVDERLEPWTCNSAAPTLGPTLIATIIVKSVEKAATF